MNVSVLRNQVNLEKNACRGKYYEAKVEHLKKCKPALCWREVEKLGRLTAANSQNAGSASFLQHLDCDPDNTGKLKYYKIKLMCG